MPTSISHIVLAEKVYEKHFKEKDKKEFYIGTCFPDIRRNAGISRKKTHLMGLKIEDIKKESPFFAGFQVHCLIDEISERYFFEKKIYSLFKEFKYPIHSIKIVLDRLLYEKVDNWKEYVNYLDTILPEEMEFGVKEGIVRDWHVTLQEYFSRKPDQESISKLFTRVCYSKENCNQIWELICLIEKEKNILDLMNEFHEKFDI